VKKTVAVRAEAFSEKHRYIDTECCQLISGSKVAYGQPSDGSCADARDPIKPRALIAKFHYTDPTGPARTFFGAKLRWVRAGRRQSPCGSGRVRVVEFSSYTSAIRPFVAHTGWVKK